MNLFHQHDLFPITKTPLPSLPSAAMVDLPAKHLSKRYGMIKTKEIVQELVNRGFIIEIAFGNRSHYGKHVLQISHPKIDVETKNFLSDQDNLKTRVILVNSHDGSTNYIANLAIFDENGNQFIIGNPMTTARVRHNLHIAKEAPNATLALTDSVPKAAALLELFQNFIPTSQQIEDLVYNATKLRWSKPPVDPMTLIDLLPNRSSLLEIITQLQAHLLNGGIKTIKQSKTRRLSRPAERVRIMRQLWALSENLL
jgi:hypothetical protein